MRRAILAAQAIEEHIAKTSRGVKIALSERQLAEDFNLSRATVRTAVQQLIDRGVLVRGGTGRLELANGTNQRRSVDIGFVSPAVPSGDLKEWWIGVKGALQDYSVNLHLVSCESWQDNSVQEALTNMRGIFFLAHPAKPSAQLIKKLKAGPARVVVLDLDYSAHGLPSVNLFSHEMEYKLFDHLYHLGHRSIDCLNTQEENVIIKARIQAWRDYLKSRGMKGNLHNLERQEPTESGYQLMRDSLRAGRSLSPALFCTTGPAAIGAMRAFYEAGLKIGIDVSVCAVNSEGLGRYLTPTLTALEAPPRAHYLQRAAQWLLSDNEWEGPLLIQPEDAILFEGESTGAPSRYHYSSLNLEDVASIHSSNASIERQKEYVLP